jgi:acetyl esterase/lipase
VLIDPADFLPAAVADETREFNEALRQLLATFPATHEMTPQEARDVRRAGNGPFGPMIVSEMGVNGAIPAAHGNIPIRVFAGDTVDAVFLHLHGGGWVLGAEDLNDAWHEEMATQAGVAVVSVGYRLAPEHPYPAGSDDCEAAAVWLVQHAVEEFGTDIVLVGGESAGAHLSAVTVIRIRDRHGFSGFAGVNLAYGAYDLTGLPSRRSTRDEFLIIDAETINWFERHALEGTDLDLLDPDVSPLYADLAGLPPALFTVGTLDPLLDDTLFMSTRWLVAGNETELQVYPGGVHAFDAFPIMIARRARLRMYAWIGERIAQRRAEAGR